MDSASWFRDVESTHEHKLEDFSNKPSAAEHVALTTASGDRLIFPTSIPKT